MPKKSSGARAKSGKKKASAKKGGAPARAKGKKAAAPKKAAKKSAAKRPAKKSAAKKSPAKKSPAKKSTAKKRPATKAAPMPSLHGWITHTDFASSDPLATKSWATKALGWQFKPGMVMPDGSEYHLFAYSEMGGGGIGRVPQGESPASVPFIKVADIAVAYARATDAGAEGVMPPNPVMDGVSIAMVRAPGGVMVGLSGP